MNDLLARFNALPRAAKWLVYFGIFVAIFVGIVRPIENLSDTVVTSERKIESDLVRQRDLFAPDGSDAQTITSLQAAFGTPLIPKPASEGGLRPEAFTRVVNGVLDSHNIMDRNVSERRVPMSGDLAGAIGVGKIDRLILEVSFEAKPDEIVSVLADLERAPEVAAVSRIRLDKSSVRSGAAAASEDQIVRATIMPEAWIVPGASGSSGGGGGGGGGGDNSQ